MSDDASSGQSRRRRHGIAEKAPDPFSWKRLLTPFRFQEEAWEAFMKGESGLIHAPTGTGKTLAAIGGPLLQRLSENDPEYGKKKSEGLQVLWITPLRALATDLENALSDWMELFGVDWSVEKRTSDSTSTQRARQKKRLPEVLVTTPESLTLMLTWSDWHQRFGTLRAIVVDEWHELLGSKRGVQTELALARLRTLQRQVSTWGVSATIDNLDEAMARIVGPQPNRPGRLIQSTQRKDIHMRSVIPAEIERFPWAGHLGIRLAPNVLEIIQGSTSSLVFTNTRSQAELWYQALLKHAPDLAGQMAVHHGSIDRNLRYWIEDQLRDGKLKCCVCTSSLDLGVDFSVVDHVIQIGSPKGIARLLQRAGRSGHRPGVPSRLTFVPTSVLELIEFRAVQDAIKEKRIEGRYGLEKPLDVLAQHLVTVAVAGGFNEQSLREEVMSTVAYQGLDPTEWQWVLDFVCRGGESLAAYPDFRRVEEEDGTYRIANPQVARRHRFNVGTIPSDTMVVVKYLKGRRIGTVEESFLSRLEVGDRFNLGGKVLELVKVHDNIAWVKKSKGPTNTVPRWMGGRMPLSAELSDSLRTLLEHARNGAYESEEMLAVEPILELQKAWSLLPARHELLIERLKNRDGYHLFFYPFEGRLVHEGLAVLVAWRIAQHQPMTFSMAMNDYGFVLVSPESFHLESAIQRGLFACDHLANDILSSMNASELCRRQFREIAKIAGLIFQGYPGSPKSGKQIQASSNLFFEVFREYDPSNLLLRQAEREVLHFQLQENRMREALKRINQGSIRVIDIPRPTPLAFPLTVDRIRDRVSSEKLADRVRRMQKPLELAAAKSMASIDSGVPNGESNAVPGGRAALLEE